MVFLKNSSQGFSCNVNLHGEHHCKICSWFKPSALYIFQLNYQWCFIFWKGFLITLRWTFWNGGLMKVAVGWWRSFLIDFKIVALFLFGKMFSQWFWHINVISLTRCSYFKNHNLKKSDVLFSSSITSF